MRIILYPFYSQQDKRTGLFRPDSDSGVKLYKYIQGQLYMEGHEAVLVVPPLDQCTSPVTLEPHMVSPPMALSNLHRRLQWDPDWLLRMSEHAGMVLTQHEFLAYPLRCLRPGLRIMMECGIRPETAWPETADLFPLAWNAADMVCCNSKSLAEMVQQRSNSPTTVWRFGYDEEIAKPRALVRTVDVLFNARASATNYSNHLLFIDSVQNSTLTTVMTDPTSYLRNSGFRRFVTEQPLNRAQYEELLHKSKVVVGLTDNGYGGYAFMEAIACGCIPVALRNAGYLELLGSEWPYYCEKHTVYHTISRAVNYGWDAVPSFVRMELRANIDQCSYQSAWRRAKKDLETIAP